MGFFHRLVTIVQARSHRAADRFEDPGEILDRSYLSQLDGLHQVRRSVAELATARKRIELQVHQLEARALKLHGQARAALGQGREEPAREALTRRAEVEDELGGLRAELGQAAGRESHLAGVARQLQDQVEAFRLREETLKASYAAAEAGRRAGEARAGFPARGVPGR